MNRKNLSHLTLPTLFLVIMVATGCGGSSSGGSPSLVGDNNSQSSSSSSDNDADEGSSSSSASADEPEAHPEVELSLEPGARSLQVDWNAADYEGASFNLCLASSELDAGFDNCASHQGAQYLTAISAPYIVDNLSLGATYWVQLEVALPDDERLLSTVSEVALSDDDSLSQILAMGAFAGSGPLKAGSILNFYELDEVTGIRLGDGPAATATVTEKGAYTFPELESRWVEVASSRVSGESEVLDIYNGGYINAERLSVNAIFDQEQGEAGRNVNILTTWKVIRTRRLLGAGDVDSLEEAYAQAADELQMDLSLNYPPEELNFFYDASLPKARLDDAGKLMALSSYLFAEPDGYPGIGTSYGIQRMEATSQNFESMKTALGDRSAHYTNRAIIRLTGETAENDEERFGGLLLQRTMNGCESARVWSNRTMVCLGEGTESLDIDIPKDSDHQRMEVFFHPETSGMWSLEIVMNDICTGAWNAYGSATSNTSIMEQTFDYVQVDQKLVSTQRFSPGLKRLGLLFANDHCDATSAQLNFRQVATGGHNLNANGLYYLHTDDSHSGVVSGHVRTSGEPLNASNRAYYMLANVSTDPKTVDISVDYQLSGSSAMNLVLEEATSPTAYIPKSSDATHTSAGLVTKRYTLPAQSVFRVQVRQENPTTYSLDNYISHTRFPYELTVQPVQ